MNVSVTPAPATDVELIQRDHGWSVDGQLLLTSVTAIHAQRLDHVYKG